jgi:ketosteroid isomerase-like protein
MSPEQAVKDAEAERCAAMLASDAGRLGAVLSDKLTFVHANARLDDKAEVLLATSSGRVVYHAIDWFEPKIDVRGDIAAMQGVMKLKATIAGAERMLHNRVILLWEKDGGAWRLLHFQSTPVAV